jgi:hypothetical protein
MTFHPFIWNNFAVILPIPEDAPVIKIVLLIFFRLKMLAPKSYSLFWFPKKLG